MNMIIIITYIAREPKMVINMRVTVIPIVIGVPGTVPKCLEKGNGRVGNRRTSRDHPGYRIVEIGLNTEKSPGDLNRLADTWTSAITYKEYNDNMRAI